MKTGLIAMLCLLVASTLSCNPSKHTYSSDPQGNKTEETSRILFINYQLTRNSATANFDAQLISMIIRDGKIKDVQHNSNQPKKDDLELLVMDRNQQILTCRHIPNPLDRSVEYVNNAGQFERKMIHLDSAQFSIRLQVESGASSILLNRFIGDNIEGPLLLKTQIQ